MSQVEQLIEQHRDYVRKLARDIHRKLPRKAEYDDLVGFGELGLVEAAQKFDPAAGAAFTTFAYYRIRGSIFDGIRKMAWLPPRPRKRVTAEAAADDIARQEAERQAAGGAGQGVEELAGRFDEVVTRLGAVFMMSDLSDEDGGGPEPSAEDDPAEPMLAAEAKQKLTEAVAGLPEKDRHVIELFYFKGKSMGEIGVELGVNKSTVSRQHAKAIGVLRDALSGVAA
ncbi:MAG: sigma-70 family RNA polymerase sigma factor [Planctomycetota bacterium]